MQKVLSKTEYCEVSVVGDGNCFFRCLSKYIGKTEDNYKFYRKIVYDYINLNKDILKVFFPQYEGETDENFNKRYDIYIANVKNDKNFATDFEISAASIILKKGIIIYKKTSNGYEFINHYTVNNKNDTDNIYIEHVNNNHFNLIYHNDINEKFFKSGLKLAWPGPLARKCPQKFQILYFFLILFNSYIYGIFFNFVSFFNSYL